MVEFIIYGKENCTYCRASKTLLDRHGVEYDYKELDTDFTFDELFDLREEYNPNHSSFPLILQVINDGSTDELHYVGGYSQLKEMFDKE